MKIARTCTITLPRPAGWGGVIGYPLGGDLDRLPEGQLRLHVVQGVEHLGAAGEGLQDDRSAVLGPQARAVFDLRGLVVPPGSLADVTAEAAQRGVTPAHFRGPQSEGKHTIPDVILMLSQPEGAVWFTGRVPIDLPTAPLIGTLHALWRTEDGGQTYVQSILGNLERDKLKQVAAESFLLMKKASRSCE